MMTPFRQPIRANDSGSDVRAVKRTAGWFAKHGIQSARRMKINGKAGGAFIDFIKEIQSKHGLKPDGIYGLKTHAIVAPHFDLWGNQLYKRAKIRKTHPHQDPPLPRFWPLWVFWITHSPTSARWGIQPSLVPQVEAICAEFDLTVTAGWGGHPPHAFRSDHRVCLAVDLAGSLENMQRCNLWADGLRGHTFRWVGGPAHDADGVEPGHYNHVHLSWYRTKPTTIFGTSLFK